MNPQPPELFSQRPIRSDFARVPSYRTRRIITVSVLALLVAGGLRLWVFNGAVLPPGEVPTVRAEGPYKQRPEQPGGIDIPHQDIQVYQSLDYSGDSKPVEHLLPPPETPQPVTAPAPSNTPPAAAAPNPPPVAEAPPVEDLSPAKPDTVQAAPPPPSLSPPASAPAPVTTPAPSPPPVAASAPPAPSAPPPAENVQPAAKPAPPVAAAPAKPSLTIDQVIKNNGGSPSDRVVQLASMQGESGAQAMADKLQSRYASILGDVQLHLTRADLGARGVYYRIQSPPVSGDQASTICAELKKLKAGRILVRP